jgi:hypothetical protein
VARRLPLTPLLALALLSGLGLLAAACGGEDEPTASGSLGPVTQADADRAVLALCETAEATDLAAAAAPFHNRAHQTLHAIAAATEGRDRAAAAGLLAAKQRVEADLAETDLPPGFADDVEALLGATRAALDAIGLDAPACPA